MDIVEKLKQKKTRDNRDLLDRAISEIESLRLKLKVKNFYFENFAKDIYNSLDKFRIEYEELNENGKFTIRSDELVCAYLEDELQNIFRKYGTKYSGYEEKKNE